MNRHNRKLSISTTVTEDEIKDRLLREHLLDIRAIRDFDDPIPKEIEWKITRNRNKPGGYVIDTWQERMPRQLIPLLGAPDEA